MNAGPLAGLRVVELAAIGPVPHAAMMLADLGAEVVLLDRPNPVAEPDGVGDPNAVVRRNRPAIRLDLRDPAGLAQARTLIDHADVLLEGNRPGVLERLGLAPELLHRTNPGLVIVRVTGWGQDGPWAQRAGHDLNYLAAGGLLSVLGRPDTPPAPPLTLVANHGGGSMMALTGLLSALWERSRSGQGQVVDVAMSEGAATLGTMVWSWRAAGRWTEHRGDNLIDGGAPFYDTYECADGRYIAFGALEPQFYAQALELLGLDPAALPGQYDTERWAELKSLLRNTFAQFPAAHWESVFEGTDACVDLVRDPLSAADGIQLHTRGAFVDVDGVRQPAPSPRFDRTPSGPVTPARVATYETVAREWGVPPS